MKNKYLIPILTLFLVCSIFAIASLINNSNLENDVGASIRYSSNPCISTTGEFEGRKTPLGEMELVGCSSNVLYDTGKELVETALGTGTADACDWIELCNSTAGCGIPTADSSENYTALAGCGMDNVAGTVASLGTGNWSIYNTFTSTCDNIETNATHLLNDADAEFAGNNFTLVTLQSADQLTVNWTVWVE